MRNFRGHINKKQINAYIANFATATNYICQMSAFISGI